MAEQAPFVLLTPEQIELGLRLTSIFMPEASRKRREWVDGGGKFAHYTSAESGLKIIQSAKLWMRSATAMADYREVLHGYDVLNRDPEVTNLLRFLDEKLDGLGKQALISFMEWWGRSRLNTTIASISEHDPSENDHGRLSMWRAFGGAGARVALILNIPLQPGDGQSLRLLVSPVSYFTKAEFTAQVQNVQKTVSDNLDFMRDSPRELVQVFAFFMLLMATLCLKHEGFREEREWRIAYLPDFIPSQLIGSSLEVINGVPQPVFHIPLVKGETPDMAGFGLPNIIDRVIIGPSQYPWIMYQAFVEALEKAGVPDAASKVIVSEIPIRA